MRILEVAKRQMRAITLRHYMKRARKKHGLPTNLKDLIAEYRAISPEYADKLEKLIFPPIFSGL